MSRIAVVTGDVIGDRMAGPAIRAMHVADELARHHAVTLVSTAGGTLDGQGFASVTARGRQLKRALASAEIVIIQGHAVRDARWLFASDRIIVADLYDPLHLEALEQSRSSVIKSRREVVRLSTMVLNEQLIRADFMMCANEAQRHLWLGHLAALGRIDVEMYEADPTMRGLLAVCPFGLPSLPPVQRSRPLHDIDGIESGDHVAIWAGGLYDWLDPLTVIRAMSVLLKTEPTIKLVFLGTVRPDVGGIDMRMPRQARELADDLGLTGRNVFFLDGWVPYDKRGDYLLDAHIGVSAHRLHLETEFSHRTRMLDYLWAGLPIVSTAGDSWSQCVSASDLGISVPAEDPDALASALVTLSVEATHTRMRLNVEDARPDLEWSRTLAPLVDFCAAPQRAADRITQSRIDRQTVLPRGRLRRTVALMRSSWRRGGPSELAGRVSARLFSRRVR